MTGEITFNSCRICLGNNNKNAVTLDSSIIDDIYRCAKVQLKDHKSHPKMICLKCKKCVQTLVQFTKRLEDTEKSLEKFVQKCLQTDGKTLNDAQMAKDTFEYLFKKETDRENNVKHYLTDPPPLVPIAICHKITTFSIDEKPEETRFTSTVNSPPIRPLPNAPPLVPFNSMNSNTYTNNPTSVGVKIKELTCSECGEKCQSVAQLVEHTTLQHKIKNKLQCNVCRKVCSSSKKLIGHLKWHKVPKRYKCNLCNKTYPSPSTLQIHTRTHTGERPYKCKICHKGFVRWYNVKSHMRTHADHRPYKCTTCNRAFKILSNLERHKILHTGEMPYCCSYCGKTFLQNNNLKLHVQSYHTKENPFLCNECGKGFVSLSRLRRHQWTHSGFKPYGCTMCKKSYSNSSDLKNHNFKQHSDRPNEIITEKRYQCKLCDMRFFHPCRLLRHAKTHERPYICTECGKSFSSDTILNKHVTKYHAVENKQPDQFILDDPAEGHFLLEAVTDDKLILKNINDDMALIPGEGVFYMQI